MGISQNVLICGAYFIYLFTVLWMLTKEVLGYPVDWSHNPPLAPAQLKYVENNMKHTQKPVIRRVILDKGEDLEANIAPPDLAGTGLDLNTTDDRTKDKTTDPDATFVEVVEDNKDVEQEEFSKDHVLPLYHAQPQPLSPVSVPVLQPDEPITDSAPSRPTTSPEPYDQVSLTITNLDLYIASKHLEHTLQEHQETTTTHRLTFVKGLQYTENNNFKFPNILSSLRVRSKRLSKKVPKTPIIDSILANTLINPSNQIITPTTRTANTTLDTTSPNTPSTPCSPRPPLSPFPITSTSSNSSYSSSYTTTDIDSLQTPVDEDIPIHLISMPSWRQDPSRAKFVFGSLARSSANTPDVISSPGAIVIVESSSESGFGVEFESMILSMGLTPSPISKNVGDGDVEGKKVGMELDGEMTTAKSRESVMSDVLSWVESSSSIA